MTFTVHSPHVVTHEGGHHVPATGVPKASVLVFLQQMQVGFADQLIHGLEQESLLIFISQSKWSQTPGISFECLTGF